MLVTQLCPTLCDPIDYRVPDSSVHGVFQARRLELIVISFSRGSSQPRNRTQVSTTVDRFFIVCNTRAYLQVFNNYLSNKRVGESGVEGEVERKAKAGVKEPHQSD